MARVATVTALTLASLLLAACGTSPVVSPTALTAAVPNTQAQALFDKSVRKLVNDIFVAYDHNRNGQIELERPSGGSLLSRIGNFLFWRDDRVRSVTSTYTENDQLTVTTRVYTRFPLFFAADADHDKRVTIDELTTFINLNYDTNHDGQLDARGLAFWHEKNELERFNADFGEQLITYRDIELPTATRPGVPTAGPATPAPMPPSTATGPAVTAAR